MARPQAGPSNSADSTIAGYVKLGTCYATQLKVAIIDILIHHKFDNTHTRIYIHFYK